MVRIPKRKFATVLQELGRSHMIAIMRHALAPLFAGSRSLDLPLGEPVVLTGQSVEMIFLLRAGRVQLHRHTSHGAKLILQNAGPDAVLAEASVYSETYHCDGIVTEAATLSALPKTTFVTALRDDPDIALAWSAMLARSVQAARVRAEIRSLPKVADRFDAWLDEGHALPEKGFWQDVAAELGVTREALYRELARRRGNPSAVAQLTQNPPTRCEET